MSQVAVAQQDGVAPGLSRSQMNVVFVTIMLGMLLSALDQTIVSTALPTIVGDLGGAGHQSWVVTAYMLAETVSTVLAGKFGDLFGRKRVFQLSVAVFIIGSIFCGLANSMVLLIAFRAVQGIGGGGLTVTATALIADVIPLRLRGQYQGALGAVFGVTTVIGPLLGGVFTDDLTWRWVFYVNVPIAVIVIALAARTIPQVRSGQRPRIDYLGCLFVALGATGLTLATSWGGTQYAWGSGTIIGLFVASVLALAIFVVVENRAAEPILPMRLFRSRVFSVCSVLSFIVGFAMIGSITFLPTFLQHVFLFAVPIAALALLLALFLPQVTMRGVAQVSGAGDGFAVPEGSDNERQLGNVVAAILRRDDRASAAQILASSGSALDIAAAWGVMGVFLREHAFGAPARESGMEARVGVPSGVLRPFYSEVVTAGYLSRDGADGDVLRLTPRGQAEAGKIVAAWKSWLMGELAGWLEAHEASPEQTSMIEAAIGRIALRLIREAEADRENAGRAAALRG